MKIYLDVDGTLIHEELTEKNGQAAAGLADFIVALRPYDVYWLTTRCTNGDATNPRQALKMVLPEEFHGDVDRIKPTVWQELKTNALDFDSDFIWFDNEIYDSEYKVLEKCNENQMVIEVDLRNNPKQLLEIISDVLN
tara:strand:+ start:674 stop:1087 length:414 start_codon:yes stop_codon:yes gene_type:complete